MTEYPGGKKKITRKLLSHLSDEQLRIIFPKSRPGYIRAVLLGQKADNVDAALPGPSRAGNKNTCCKLFTDGASRGNPGLAGAGAVIYDGDGGEELCSLARFIGTCTNNVAEYKALIAGIELAGETGCWQLDIFLDSELIVRQITGRYKVKNQTLKPLFAAVIELLAKFEKFTVNHVPRAENSRADELANRGIDERTG